jgi:transposase
MPFDPQHLPDDPQVLQQMVLDLMAQLDREYTERAKIESLLRELLDAKRNRKSEQLSEDQLALFASLFEARQAQREQGQPELTEKPKEEDDHTAGASGSTAPQHGGGRQPLARHLKRERIVHDLAEADKHCSACGEDLRPIGEESSERYEYIPAQVTVIEEVCKKYACACTVRTATKPPQPIEKSTAGASLLAQVIVAKTADHLPLHRQQQIWARHGVEISRQTMCGWLGQCADLLRPLYAAAQQVLFESKVIGTDDTAVKVLDEKLPFARTGRIWPYYGDEEHPVILYDYTATRARAGPEEFLQGYRGHLQADAYGGYDAFFKDPARGLTEVGCWAHARRYFHKALESDPARMGPALLLIAQLYRVEQRARGLTSEDRLRLRQRYSRGLLEKLHDYLVEIEVEVLPKSPEGRAVRYTLKNWTALTRFCADGDLEIDNNRTERALRGVAVGRNNWVFFGSDRGGKTAAVLRSFVASCQRAGVDPFAWFKDVLSRIAAHPISRLAELLPHNWAPAQA